MSKFIPDRWLDYKAYGTVIRGTKILPFKVPLKEAMTNHLEPEKRFTASVLLEAFPRLKCIIDLTNTGRYYNEKDITNYGIKYEKIMVRGHEVPSMEVVNKFFQTMDDFTSTCDEDDIVGVHCTHGINRTGYLICRYLIQKLNWEPENCIKAFEEARGYPIERENYINALKSTPRKKIHESTVDRVSKVKLARVVPYKLPMPLLKPLRSRPPSSMGPPRFAPPRPSFAKDGPFSLPHFNFGVPPPAFRPMPPPGMPPIPPLPGPPPMCGPMHFRYGQSGPSMPPPPPRPGFPVPGFPPPCPSRTLGRTRMPQNPPVRLPPPKMLPPRPPQSVSGRLVHLRRQSERKRKPFVGSDIRTLARNSINVVRHNSQTSRIHLKWRKEQDFTIDTFEENLLAVSGQSNRLLPKGRSGQRK